MWTVFFCAVMARKLTVSEPTKQHRHLHPCEDVKFYNSHEIVRFLLRMCVAALHSLAATDTVNRI
jgi:hypothetical protein